MFRGEVISSNLPAVVSNTLLYDLEKKVHLTKTLTIEAPAYNWEYLVLVFL